jgi:hypothetical protein
MARRSAAIAADSVQPVPWVFPVAIRFAGGVTIVSDLTCDDRCGPGARSGLLRTGRSQAEPAAFVAQPDAPSGFFPGFFCERRSFSS